MTLEHLAAGVLAIVSLTMVGMAQADQVYRCGNSYSQVPCAQGKVLTIDDSRDAARKKEVDAATRRDTQLANQLEYERLQQEQSLAPKSAKPAKPKTVKQKKTAPNAEQDQTTTITPKRPRSALHKPKDFTALVPGSDQHSNGNKKTAKPKSATSK